MNDVDYKEKYLALLARVGKTKEQLVDEVYVLLGVAEDCEIHSGYGFFIWKLTVDELVYLKKILEKR